MLKTISFSFAAIFLMCVNAYAEPQSSSGVIELEPMYIYAPYPSEAEIRAQEIEDAAVAAQAPDEAANVQSETAGE